MLERGQEGAQVGTRPRPRLEPVRADTVKKREMQWLWHNWLPRGTLTMFTGDPEAGKSTIICELAARLSRGELLPGETEPRKPEVVWILSSEDASDTTIVWRLENQGGDLSRIWLVDKQSSLDQAALREIAEFIRAQGVTLVVIDTLTTWMGGDIDMNRANEIMAWLNKLTEIAHSTGATFILVRHKRKGSADDNKLYTGLGSIGFTASVRSEIMAIVRKDGQRVLEKTKGNVGAKPPKLAYNIGPNPDPTNSHGVLAWNQAWIEPITTKTTSGRPKTYIAALAWLAERLKDGPVPVQTLMEEGSHRHFTARTLRMVREEIGNAVKTGQNGWVWQLRSAA